MPNTPPPAEHAALASGASNASNASGARAGGSDARRGYVGLATLFTGYVALYLARKNLSVAMPLLQEAFGVTKEAVGAIASAGTLAYAFGKVGAGPIVDRLGGRTGFLLSLIAVALCTAASGLPLPLAMIGVAYAANRVFGAATWGAMLKLVPSWFSGPRVSRAIAFLSLSYVLGGAAAILFAREVIHVGGGYRAVLAAPAIPLVVVGGLAAVLLPRAALTTGEPASTLTPPDFAAYRALVKSPTFLLACVLSFLVTLLREGFGTWSVDFLAHANGGKAAIEVAAVQSIGFDIAGGAGILAMGAAYSALGPRRGKWLVVGSLVAVAGVIAALVRVSDRPILAAALLAGVGFLLYGPFSLLGGLLSIESGGPRLTASAAGLIDGVGYAAGAASGVGLGRLFDRAGYAAGFHVLAVVALMAAVFASRLRLQR